LGEGPEPDERFRAGGCWGEEVGYEEGEGEDGDEAYYCEGEAAEGAGLG